MLSSGGVKELVENTLIKGELVLMRESIERITLERAARQIERLSGNSTYAQAWRIAARAVRSLKVD